MGGSTGSAAIEFALLGTATIALVLEALQVGLFGYQSIALERATYHASRGIKLGSSNSQNFDATSFRNSLCASLPAGMLCSSVVTNVQNTAQGLYPSGFYKFVKTDQSGTIPPTTMDNSKTSFCPGQPGSFVYVQVYYAMPAFSPTWRIMSAVQWQGSLVHFIAAQAVFRNEPYVSTGNGC